MKYNELKPRFYHAFSNLPIPIRSSIIYVSTEHGSMTWHVVWLEVKADTPLGMEALEFLARSNFI